MKYSSNHELIHAQDDISRDLDELEWLTLQLEKTVKHFQKTVKHSSSAIDSTVSDMISNRTQSILDDTDRIKASLLKHKQKNAPISTETIYNKLSIHRQLRHLYGIVGALKVSADWQSPSSDHATHSQAGTQTGKIHTTINDYKRDQNLNAIAFEQKFLQQYIEAPKLTKNLIYTYATTSGMAAFTTLLCFLQMEGKGHGSVLAGSSTYFECQDMIRNAFGQHTIFIDDTSTAKIIKQIDHYRPSILFLDTLSNNAQVNHIDIDSIISHLRKSAAHDTYVILDNSAMSLGYQPFRTWVPVRSKLKILVFESLNKFHQFGLDRTTGGIIYAAGGDVVKLFDYRVHLGTNISDHSVSMIPIPNRTMLHRRMSRISRNASIVAAQLAQFASQNPKIVKTIHHPSLNPSSSEIKDDWFKGAFLTIEFTKKHQTIPSYKSFVTRVLKYAKSTSTDIVLGTSFGLTTTRVYLTSLRADRATPFIRIAAGTETKSEMEQISQVIIQALKTV